MGFGADTLFYKTEFIGHDPFFHFILFLFSKIVICGVQNQNGKLIFRLIVSIDVWHAVTSVVQTPIS